MENEKPLISIIMPAYNAEKTVDRAIASVLSQTYTNFELIIINDGSQDNTLAICEKYSDTRIIIASQRNQGASNARNKGISLSHGTYICFIDSDDWYVTNYLSKMVETIRTEKTDLVVCNMMTHQNNTSYSKNIIDTTYKNPLENKSFLLLFEFGIMNPTWNKLYKKEIIDTWRLNFENIYVEDLFFNLNYLKHTTSVSTIKDVLYHYALTGTGLTSEISAEMFRDYISVHTSFLNMVPVSFHNIISQCIYHQYIALTMRYLNKIRRKELRKKDVYPILNKYLNSLLVKNSIRIYRPKNRNEAIVHYLIRFHCFSILLFVLKIAQNK